MELRTVSSGLTFTAKFVVPVFWISILGLLGIWFQTTRTDGGVDPEDPKFLILAAWSIGTLFVLLVTAPLKRVRTDAQNIYVSNYFHEVITPLANIRDVTESPTLNSVRVRFRDPTRFGARIVFMPTIRLFGLGRSHPIVAELRELSRLSEGKTMGGSIG